MRRWRFDTWLSWLGTVTTAALLGIAGTAPLYVAVGIVSWFAFGYVVGKDQAQPVAPREHS